jgi:TolC family type I secretion outer membrane protein
MNARTGLRLALAAVLAAAPVSRVPAETVPLPETPGRGIVPGAFPERPADDARSIPEDILARRDHLTLPDVLDVALRNDPATQIAWRDARSRADALGAAKGDWWPELDVTVAGVRAKTSVQGGRFDSLQTTYGPGAALTWVLADFGERSGNVKSAKDDALSAVWAHSATVQATVLRTIEAYVAYLDAKAQLVAAKTTEDEAATNLDAAEQRRGAGLATIADVLQAKTQRSQAKLIAQTLEGSIGSLRGTLATAMGLPANVSFEVGELPAQVPVVEFGATVDEMIADALARRPDLAAARESWLSAKANVTAKRGEWLPRLDLSGNINRSYYSPETYAGKSDTWSVGLFLRIPVFNGLRNKYEIAQAREDEGRAAAQARAVEQSVTNQVWTSWYDVKTATQRIETSKDLLDSATESEKVALGRYKEGVGTLLDLLNAQSALALARAQEIAARADWLVAAARLIYSTGGLTGPEVLPR